MPKKIVVTGGAGFIGSHLVDALIQRGHQVRVLDNLDSQVHGTSAAGKPLHLHPEAEFIYGDVLNEADVKRAIDGMEIIFHQAAVVGVGQSMYQIARYVMANTLGTAQLMDFLVNHKNRIQKVIVAASMSSYGEGAYACDVCGVVYPPPRPETQMARGDWEVQCPLCETHPAAPIPTPEDKPQQVHSIYALTKKNQEEIALMIGKTYRLPVVALRYFNVYGPRQSLSNPYTGVAAIFMSRIKNGNQPIIYEDGLQTRDFVSVHDIVKANLLAMERDEADYQVFNVGSGVPITIREVATTLAQLYAPIAFFGGEAIQPQITNQFRKGDVRHCYADISKIRKRLSFSADVSFERGMMELVRWAFSAPAEDKFELATRELKAKGLF